MKFKVLIFAFTLIVFSINLYADEYKFDYAVIDNEKVTTVSASNITAHLVSESKATVTYKNETVTLTSKDGYEYKGFGESGVVIVSNKVNGVLSRITIGGTFRGQTVILVYKRINSKQHLDDYGYFQIYCMPNYCGYHLFYSWAYRLEYCMFMG